MAAGSWQQTTYCIFIQWPHLAYTLLGLIGIQVSRVLYSVHPPDIKIEWKKGQLSPFSLFNSICMLVWYVDTVFSAPIESYISRSVCSGLYSTYMRLEGII